jgi:hypothetical protein
MLIILLAHLGYIYDRRVSGHWWSATIEGNDNYVNDLFSSYPGPEGAHHKSINDCIDMMEIFM